MYFCQFFKNVTKTNSDNDWPVIANNNVAMCLRNLYIHFGLNFRVKIIYIGSTVRQYYGILNSWVTLPTQMMRATRRESCESPFRWVGGSNRVLLAEINQKLVIPPIYYC